MTSRDDDAWEDLVRRLEATDSGTVEPFAAEEDAERTEGEPGAPRRPADVGPDDTGSRPTPPAAGGAGPRAVRGFDFAIDPALLGSDPGRGAGPGPRDWQAAEDPAADRFVPEEPAPLLAGRPDRVVAWIAALGLPLIMLVCVIFFAGKTSPLLMPMLGIGSLAAWGYLFWKLPTHRHDDGDDGARV